MNIPKKEIPCTCVPGSTEPIKMISWKNVMGYFSYDLPAAYCIDDYEEELSKVIKNSDYFSRLPWTYQNNKEFMIKAVTQNKKVYLQLYSPLKDDPELIAIYTRNGVP